jgi:hypothetical protein
MSPVTLAPRPVGYNAAHDRVRRDRGPAHDYRCVGCGRPARHWAYDHGDPDELASALGPYSLDLDRYRPLCVGCHKRADLDHRARARFAMVKLPALPGPPCPDLATFEAHAFEHYRIPDGWACRACEGDDPPPLGQGAPAAGRAWRDERLSAADAAATGELRLPLTRTYRGAPRCGRCSPKTVVSSSPHPARFSGSWDARRG